MVTIIKHDKVVLGNSQKYSIFGNVTYSIDRLTVVNVLIGVSGNYFAELNKFSALISSSTSVLVVWKHSHRYKEYVI